MRIAYFDCIAGISGDMTLGALVDAGADLRAIEDRVRGLLDQGDLPADARHTAHRIFRRLAEAEARVHNKELDLVTFHEIGALDSIVDIVGVALGLAMLGIERAFASPVPTGFGMHRTEHGMVPIPSPTVMELLRGVPMYSRGVPVELVTPTGAAILSAVSEGYGELPLIRIEGVGYGAGTHRLDFPNVLRIILGDDQVATARPPEAHTSEELAMAPDVEPERLA